ncbi:MAG: hypothetical protein ABI623_13070, partial [bacterium]
MSHGRNLKDTNQPVSSEERIAFLEKESLRRVNDFDLLASMQDVYALSGPGCKKSEIISSSREHVGRLDLFRAMAFVMGDGEDLDLRIEDCTPSKRQQFFETEIDLHKADGKWDYALQISHAIVVPGI